MNLHQIASGAVALVNPFVLATIQAYSGVSTSADGVRVPTYTTFSDVSVQLQPSSNDELRMMDALNITGERATMFLNGDWRAVLRAEATGGDLVTIGAKLWLIVAVPESWPDWSKCLLQRQMTP